MWFCFVRTFRWFSPISTVTHTRGRVSICVTGCSLTTSWNQRDWTWISLVRRGLFVWICVVWVCWWIVWCECVGGSYDVSVLVDRMVWVCWWIVWCEWEWHRWWLHCIDNGWIANDLHYNHAIHNSENILVMNKQSLMENIPFVYRPNHDSNATLSPIQWSQAICKTQLPPHYRRIRGWRRERITEPGYVKNYRLVGNALNEPREETGGYPLASIDRFHTQSHNFNLVAVLTSHKCTDHFRTYKREGTNRTRMLPAIVIWGCFRRMAL